MSQGLILPHGGSLVNSCIATKNISGMTLFNVPHNTRTEIENIAEGILSPLDGFMDENDFESVLKDGRLSDGTPWTIPIVLDVEELTARKLKDSNDVLLSTGEERFGILHVTDLYKFDRKLMANSVYGTVDPNHPGVKKVNAMDDTLVAGKIEVFSVRENTGIRRFRSTPSQTRKEISRANWKTVAGFQTRNVPHNAHEMLQKAALNIYDGLFINPLIGKKKTGDFTDEMIIKAYDVLIRNYYQRSNVLFATLHTEMRYAGPREAVHHAIIRKNFGCTHFIVGRDHAGVGHYYSPYAAHEIFKDYPDLDIQPLFFTSFYYCKRCISYANEKTCPHPSEFREELSGTMIRKMVSTHQVPEKYLMRPEVSSLIISSKNPFVQE